MIYEYDLVVPANTLLTSPASVKLVLCHGIIHKLEVSFPPGCHNTVKVVIQRALHQVWPTNPDGQLKSNAYTISYPEWYPLEEAPYELTAYGWSPGTSYSHTISIRIGIERREVLEPGREAITFLGRLKTFVFGGSS